MSLPLALCYLIRAKNPASRGCELEPLGGAITGPLGPTANVWLAANWFEGSQMLIVPSHLLAGGAHKTWTAN